MTADPARPERGYDESSNYPLESFRGLTLLPRRVDIVLASLVGGPLAVCVGLFLASEDWVKDTDALHAIGLVIAVAGAVWTVGTLVALVRRSRRSEKH
jgi:hypothetical protein